ncbi:hypothetical protein [Pseudactinotalea sp. HY158]|uniref:hypothetical protein n=1 Tax=Pseudactinotalea sp. HY158 TaxID=2654547 RepID=UPI00129D06B6|nr:hypothetical protein [Pseudactinotalea sp. HY158]QGH68562.1 hypothetical protein GCE65_02835 [Pseudactinotalea sp. HY158]
MLDNETRQFFVREAATLAPVLYPLLDDAVAAAEAVLPFDGSEYPHLFSHYRRAEFRRTTEPDGVLPPGWTLGGNPRLSGQVIFTHVKERASLRLLSENRANANGIPHAGSNQARQAAWAKREQFWQGALIPDRDLLLLLSMSQAEPSLRVVRTLTTGQYSGRVACDFELPLLRESVEYNFERFDGSDEGEDLFDVYIEGSHDA